MRILCGTCAGGRHWHAEGRCPNGVCQCSKGSDDPHLAEVVLLSGHGYVGECRCGWRTDPTTDEKALDEVDLHRLKTRPRKRSVWS